MEEKQELIVLEQLPIIKTHLEKLSVEIKDKVNKAVNLICDEDTVKDVKSVRASLNKEFKELEEQRKTVKSAIMAKYDEFELIYKENVSDIYKTADNDLKKKIDDVEIEIKNEKEKEVREFANEHIISRHLESIIDANNIKLNVTLSISMKKLKDEVLEFIDRVDTDIKMIELEEFKDEILVEYKNNLNFAESKMTVVNRHKALEEMKMKEAVRVEAVEEDKQVVEMAVEELHAPVEIATQDEEPEEQLMVVAFQVTATKEQIKELKQYLIEKGIQYE